MAEADLWPVIHEERKALAADLGGLSDEQWALRSLCRDWSVRDTLAHVAATAKITPPLFFVKMIGSGFSLTRLQNKDIAVETGQSPADTLARFEAQIPSEKHPPGPADMMLGETIVHGEDIRRPLGIRHAYPAAAVARAADFYSGSNLIIGGKNRVAGLTLKATDTNWSHGQGPEVSGPILALLLAITGRKLAAGELAGQGAQTLRVRAR
jgi:uncharacterized protein (TIGR03083 family)